MCAGAGAGAGGGAGAVGAMGWVGAAGAAAAVVAGTVSPAGLHEFLMPKGHIFVPSSLMLAVCSDDFATSSTLAWISIDNE